MYPKTALNRLPENASAYIESHLTDCSLCRTRMDDVEVVPKSVAKIVTDKGHVGRREPRFPVNDSAEIELILPNRVERMGCRTLDVSKNGMKLCVVKIVKP